MNGASGVQLPEGNERAEKNSAIRSNTLQNQRSINRCFCLPALFSLQASLKKMVSQKYKAGRQKHLFILL